MVLLDLNQFLKDNALWIALSILAIIIIVVILILVSKKKGTKKTSKNELYEQLIAAFGTINNIISSSAKGSRLSLVLREYELLNNEKLEALGVSSSIRMSSKITFVLEQAQEVSDYINKELERLSKED